MKLKYLDEYINDKDGNTYQVLDTSSIDFSGAVKGIKINEFLVIEATGGECIETINSEDLIETVYIATKGDAIFYNSSKDKYVPRDSNGCPLKYKNITDYGYTRVSEKIDFYGKPSIKVQSKIEGDLLPNIISTPSVIKDAFGKNNHQFLVVGSTLKRNLKNGQITGIDPIAFATTWKTCTNKQKYSKE